MRCLFTHLWKINVKSVHAYRTCKRCGTAQRGIYDCLYQDIAWETMRARAYVTPEQFKIVRKPISRLDQLTHSLGLRRSRMTDRTASGNQSART